MKKTILIFGKENCPYCVKAKDIPYPEEQYEVIYKDIGSNVEYKAELLMMNPSAKTVPQIWVDYNYVGGYDDFRKYAIENF